MREPAKRARVMPENKASQVCAALRVSAAMLAAQAAHADLLQTMVLDKKTLRADLTVTYGRLLRTEAARDILSIFWRESPQVSGHDLHEVGLPPKMNNGCNAYALARKLSESADDLAALNSQIRSIAVAAEAYDLITRESDGHGGKKIVGTPLLHEFMMQVSQEQERQIAALIQQ